MKKNNLDEMQEQKLLHLESRGYWLAFWGLLALMAIQVLIYGIADSVRYIAGEWVIFMILCIYLFAGCMKNGIWDRRLKAETKTNLLMSIATAFVYGAFMMLLKIRENDMPISMSLVVSAISAVFIFVVVFVALEISRVSYAKRVKKLENESEDDE